MSDQHSTEDSLNGGVVPPTDERAALERRVRELENEVALLQETTERFRLLSELVSDCCWARWGPADGTTERQWVNDKFQDLTGYTPEEFEEVGREGLVHPEDLAAVQPYVDGPVGTSELEFRIVRKDGEVRWLHETMRVDAVDCGLRVLGATRDITSEKEAQRVLRADRDELERRVEERTAELRGATARLEAEVRERRQAQHALELAKEQAEAASRAKSWFLASVSHELRTPLSAIVGIAHLLQTMEDPQKAREFVKTLDVSAQRLRALIDDVLDFSRIEASGVTLDLIDFRLRDVFDEVLRIFAPRAEDKGLDLSCEIAEDLPVWVRGDPARFDQIVSNLVDNAVKFTEMGSIDVRVEAEGSAGDGLWLRVEVDDTGIGLEAEGSERLFDAFTQADGSTTRRYGGTGLGLAICRRLVEMLGGQIGVSSEPGKGSVFFFTARFEESRHGATEPVDTGDATPSDPQRQLDGRSILVAEDDPSNQVVISEQLRLLGCAVEVVDNGLDAVRAVAERSFDLVLMDCHMPVMTGYEATRRLRSSPDGDRLPIIAITADVADRSLAECREVGVSDVLAKPYRLEQLEEILVRHLRPG